MNERAVTFSLQGQQMVAVLSEPLQPADTGVLVVVGGPQYRAGSHRQFVMLARQLAAAGVAVLRFDVRGMGDSQGDPRPFDGLNDDVAAALDTLHHEVPTLQRVLLFGLCDGASAALLYLHHKPDPRVCGLVLLNPWVRSAQSLAATHVKHYYRQRLMQGDFWRKLLRGGVALAALRELAGKLRQMRTRPAAADSASLPFQQRMAQALAAFKQPVLLLLSGDDYTAREFEEHARSDAAWRAVMGSAHLSHVRVADADHTFSSSEAHSALLDATLRWLTPMARAHSAVPGSLR